jgi:hypothetical protein
MECSIPCPGIVPDVNAMSKRTLKVLEVVVPRSAGLRPAKARHEDRGTPFPGSLIYHPN